MGCKKVNCADYPDKTCYPTERECKCGCPGSGLDPESPECACPDAEQCAEPKKLNAECECLCEGECAEPKQFNEECDCACPEIPCTGGTVNQERCICQCPTGKTLKDGVCVNIEYNCVDDRCVQADPGEGAFGSYAACKGAGCGGTTNAPPCFPAVVCPPGVPLMCPNGVTQYGLRTYIPTGCDCEPIDLIFGFCPSSTGGGSSSSSAGGPGASSSSGACDCASIELKPMVYQELCGYSAPTVMWQLQPFAYADPECGKGYYDLEWCEFCGSDGLPVLKSQKFWYLDPTQCAYSLSPFGTVNLSANCPSGTSSSSKSSSSKSSSSQSSSSNSGCSAAPAAIGFGIRSNGAYLDRLVEGDTFNVSVTLLGGQPAEDAETIYRLYANRPDAEDLISQTFEADTPQTSHTFSASDLLASIGLSFATAPLGAYSFPICAEASNCAGIVDQECGGVVTVIVSGSSTAGTSSSSAGSGASSSCTAVTATSIGFTISAVGRPLNDLRQGDIFAVAVQASNAQDAVASNTLWRLYSSHPSTVADIINFTPIYAQQNPITYSISAEDLLFSIGLSFSTAPAGSYVFPICAEAINCAGLTDTECRGTVVVIVGATSSSSSAASVTPNTGTNPVALAVHNDTERAYVLNSGNNTITAIDGTTKTALQTFTPTNGSTPLITPTNVVVHQTADRVYAGFKGAQQPVGTSLSSYNKGFAVINPNDNTIVTVVPTERISAMAVSEANNRLYLVTSGAGLFHLSIYDTTTNLVTATMLLPYDFSAISVYANGSTDELRLVGTNHFRLINNIVGVGTDSPTLTPYATPDYFPWLFGLRDIYTTSTRIYVLTTTKIVALTRITSSVESLDSFTDYTANNMPIDSASFVADGTGSNVNFYLAARRTFTTDRVLFAADSGAGVSMSGNVIQTGINLTDIAYDATNNKVYVIDNARNYLDVYDLAAYSFSSSSSSSSSSTSTNFLPCSGFAVLGVINQTPTYSAVGGCGTAAEPIYLELYGNNSNNVTRSVSLVVNLTRTYSIRVKTSCEFGFDYGRVFHNGTKILELSGSTNQLITRAMVAGDALTVTYQKDGSITEGNDIVTATIAEGTNVV